MTSCSVTASDHLPRFDDPNNLDTIIALWVRNPVPSNTNDRNSQSSHNSQSFPQLTLKLSATSLEKTEFPQLFTLSLYHALQTSMYALKEATVLTDMNNNNNNTATRIPSLSATASLYVKIPVETTIPTHSNSNLEANARLLLQELLTFKSLDFNFRVTNLKQAHSCERATQQPNWCLQGHSSLRA